MIKTIIKRDGSKEEFTASKVNKWGIWSASTLGDRVDWSSIVLDAVRDAKEEISSQDLQSLLIKKCIEQKDWPHNLMGGRLYASHVRKEMYGNAVPTVKELFNKMQSLGLMKELNYTDEEYKAVESIIDHTRDFNYAHFQISQIRTKYSLQNRITKEKYESTQFTFMRMAMALAEDEVGETKLIDVKGYYDEFSLSRINPPSPNYINLGTKLNGYASCNLYAVGDNLKSLAIGDHIAYTMTYMSAGIGGYLGVRSIGDPIRGGLIEHKGKLPYYDALAKAVKANTQAGRGGACTTYFTCFDPEVITLIMLQNPNTPVDKQNRDIHFGIQYNRLFAKKVAREEKIFLFNCYTAPDLNKLFFSADQDGFEVLYNKYEADTSFKKTYISARDILHMARQQAYEVSTLYEHFVDEANRHTPFVEPIYSSNLCCEIMEPTSPYFNMMDLYSEKDNGLVCFTDSEDNYYKLPFSRKIKTNNRGITFIGDLKVGDDIGGAIVKEIHESSPTSEVALCSLAAIVVCNINSDEEYEKSTYYSLKMIDKCIHMSDYPLPHVGWTAKNRLNAGVGILGAATLMARKGIKYSTQEGRNEIHRMSEQHSYFLIKASLKLGKEKGNAPWIHKTKWPRGWLPIDTYKRAVDKLVEPIYVYDWEKLRAEIIANGGIRNSCVIAHMPTESSSKASGVPNSWYPIRKLSMKKTDESSVLDWVAVDNDILADQYENAYEIPTMRMIENYAIIQKFTDQGISADFWRDRSTPEKVEVPTSEMTQEFLQMVKLGMKGRYYQNSLTTVGQTKEVKTTEKQELCASGACDV